MKLSQKSSYGVRLMMDLAMHQGGQPVLLKDIARRQEISEKFLWQIVSVLKEAGLVFSFRGSRGGYSLSRAPSRINLKEIVCALEGHICLMECVGQPLACSRSKRCAARGVWMEVADKVMKTLGALSLQHLAERQKKIDAGAKPRKRKIDGCLKTK